MTYYELRELYNKMSRRLHLYYILHNEKVSESIKLRIEKRVHKLLDDRRAIDLQMKEMEDNNNVR